jgi:hypothetical protein
MSVGTMISLLPVMTAAEAAADDEIAIVDTSATTTKHMTVAEARRLVRTPDEVTATGTSPAIVPSDLTFDLVATTRPVELLCPALTAVDERGGSDANPFSGGMTSGAGGLKIPSGSSNAVMQHAVGPQTPATTVVLEVKSLATGSGPNRTIIASMYGSSTLYVGAAYNAADNTCLILAKGAGGNFSSTPVSKTLTFPCKIYLTVGRCFARMSVDQGAGIEFVAAERIDSYVDLSDPAVLAEMRYTAWQYYDGGGSTSDTVITRFAAGTVGATGYKEPWLVTRSDGSPVFGADGRVCLTIDSNCASTGSGVEANNDCLCGAWEWDRHTNGLRQTSAIFFEDVTGHVYPTQDGQLVYDPATGASSYVFYDGARLNGGTHTNVSLYLKEVTGVDLRYGVHILRNCTKLTLPRDGSHPSSYDSWRVVSNGTTWFAYVAAAGSFYNVTGRRVVVCSGTSPTTLTEVWSEVTGGIDGVKIVKIGGALFVTWANLVDSTVEFRALATGAVVTPPTVNDYDLASHPMIFGLPTADAGTVFYMLGFDEVGDHAMTYVNGTLKVHAAAEVDGLEWPLRRPN